MAYLVSITFAHFPVKVSLGLPLYIMQSVAKKNTKEKIGTRIIATHNHVKFHVLDNIFLISDFQVQACDIFSTTDYIIVAKHEKRA